MRKLCRNEGFPKPSYVSGCGSKRRLPTYKASACVEDFFRNSNNHRIEIPMCSLTKYNLVLYITKYKPI